MQTNQIYALVNSVTQQAYGSAAQSVVDLQGLISLGNTVLSSSTNTEAFLNTLVQRIGRTVFKYRRYRNKLADMVLGDMEYGAILQKVYVDLPSAETDQQYSLVDGQSIDHYVVQKPAVNQKLFVERNPYQVHVTIQRKLLKEAFLSEAGISRLISTIFGQIRNWIEITYENLGRMNIAAGIAESSHAINLVTEYNTLASTTMTAGSALLDSAFIRYAIRRIREVSDQFTDMGVMWNDGTHETFTPYEDQKLRVYSPFERAAETVVEWAAFNEEYIRLMTYSKLNFWQAQQNPDGINVKKPSDGTAFTVENVIAVLHDRDAMGIYQMEEDVLTTPVNAAGNYYNTYYHIRTERLLDTVENFAYFTLN